MPLVSFRCQSQSTQCREVLATNLSLSSASEWAWSHCHCARAWPFVDPLPISIAFFTRSDGIGRTGTFICIHAQLERVKTEGVVDVFQFVKSSRISRPNFLSEQVGSSTMCCLYIFTYLSLSLSLPLFSLPPCRSITSFPTTLWLTSLIHLTHTLTSRI